MGEAAGKRKYTRADSLNRGTVQYVGHRQLRELLEDLHLIAVMLDTRGRITFCNDFLLRLAGWERDEVIGRDWFDTFLPEDQRDEVRREFFTPALKDRAPAHYENEIVTRAGARRLIAWNNTLMRDNHGRIIGTASIGEDITERRQSEEEIRRRDEILDLAPVIIRDLEDRIVLWNTGSERLYGYSRDEALGRDSHELLKTGFSEPLEDIKAGLYRDEIWKGELVHTASEGSRINVISQWVLHKDREGAPSAILEINTDITEKKKIEAQLLRSQRMESIGTLASGIAHDLNNVLSPVMMALEVLRMRHTDEESKVWLRILDESVERGADMVKQVLSFARGSDGARVPASIKHLLEDIRIIIRETFPKTITLRYSASDDLWGIYADPTQLHQVLLNIVVNARDAMPQGGMLTLEAENRSIDESYAEMIAEAKPGRYVAVSISDTGAGMSPEVTYRAFDPFFTTKEPGKGTGLGLSTAHNIVKAHGGFITVHSEPGRGTRFTFYIPSAEAEEEARESAASAALPVGSGELILVVDDEESIRQITAKTLEAFGYRILTASDGTEAVAIYAHHKDEIAVVICDMMMPYMDGRATTLALQRMNPQVKVVSSSGLAEAARVRESALPKVNAFLPKPYTAEALLITLANILSESP